ncbi:hypothetical protein Bbelb_425360 [Branchiostoma belcheri]|nr:hypothetical protein Bbelb_425360 [Branchiostoma belcheri]
MLKMQQEHELKMMDSLDVRVYGSAETIVTACRIPDEFDDNYVRNWLDRYTIRNGNRQYKVLLNPGANIPSSWKSMDGRIVFFHYVGQVRTCIKCQQEGHMTADCTTPFCSKCQTVGQKLLAMRKIDSDNIGHLLLCKGDGAWLKYVPGTMQPFVVTEYLEFRGIPSSKIHLYVMTS